MTFLVGHSALRLVQFFNSLGPSVRAKFEMDF
jgi:hypothetical protein